MRKIINKFKEPIYKDDLFYVILYGFIMMFLVSFIIAAFNVITESLLGVGLRFFTVFIGITIGHRVNKSYYNNHILYVVIAVFFTIIGLILTEVFYFILIIDPKLMISLNVFYYIKEFFKFEFFVLINSFNMLNRNFYNVYNLINVLIVIITIYYAIHYSK